MVNLPGNPVARLSEYELRHLVPHLEECGLVEELHRLLALETSTHSNAWFEARQAYDDVVGYLDDVNRAWRLAEASYSPTDEPQEAQSLGLQVRYALIISSVHSLISNISPILLAALVEKGIWTPLRAFEYAKRYPYSAEAFRRLAPYLDAPQLIEAISLVWNLPEDRRKWLHQLFALAPEITTKLGREVLSPTESQSDNKASLEELLGNALAKLAEQIPSEQITDALRIAQELSSNAFAALPVLLSRLARVGATREAIKIAKDIGDSSWRVRALSAILPYLPEYEKNSIACSETSRILQESFLLEQIRKLALLIPYLPLEELPKFRELRSAYSDFSIPLTRYAVITHALECAHKIDDTLWQAEALAYLASVLPETERLNILREALPLVKAIEPESSRYHAMEALADQLQGPLWSEALDIVRSVQEPLWRYATLKPLISKIPDSYLPEVLGISLDFQGWYERYETLKLLAPRLTEPMLRDVLETIYPTLAEDEDDDKQEDAWYEKGLILGALVPYLPETLVREALVLATPQRRFLEIEPRRFTAMRGILIPQLARLGFPEEAMSAIREYRVELNAEFVRAIAPHLSETMLGELLAMVKNLSLGYERKQALDGLVPYLSPTLLQEALKVASIIGDTVQLTQTLGKTADLLARLGYTQAAVEIVSHVGKATERASILREMIETSTGAGRSLIIAEALKAARQIESIEEKVEAVAALMPHFSETERESLVDELLGEMEKQKQADFNKSNSRLDAKIWLNRQIKILTTLAEKLPEDKRQPLLAKALSLARGTEPVVSLPDPVEKFTKLDPDQQAQIYIILQAVEKAPLIWRLLRTFLIIWATEDTANGINGLFGLLTWLSGFERFSMLMHTYRIAWEIQEKEQRAQMFVKLLPLYPQGFIPIVLDQVLAAIRLVEGEVKQAMLLNEVRAFVSGDEDRRKVSIEWLRLGPPKSWSPEEYEEPFVDMLVEMERNRKWTDSFPSIVRHLVRKVIRRAKFKFPSFEPAFRPAPVSETFFDQIFTGKDAKLRDQAQALTRIAALLPEMERKTILNEALEVAHTMDNERDKADALLGLFPLFPENERLQIFQEAVAEIWKCESISESFSSLIALIPHLTEAEKPVIIPEMLRVVLKGGEDYGGSFNQGSKILAKLLPHLSETQIHEVLDVLRSCPVENWRLAGIVIIATRLVELGHLDEGFGLISEIPNQGFRNVWWKSWGLGRIAFSLPESLVRQALEMAQSLPVREAGDERAYSIAMLSYRLAKLGHVRESLTILRKSIPDTMWYAFTLSAMADLVSEHERIEIIRESFAVARSLTDSSARTKCLDATASQRYKLPADTRYLLWKEWLRDAATRIRTDLLAEISSLMPDVAIYGLGSALYETGRAIQDVGRWWP